MAESYHLEPSFEVTRDKIMVACGKGAALIGVLTNGPSNLCHLHASN